MTNPTHPDAPAQWPVLSLRSEFGWAQVSVDTSANGPRLAVHSPRTGHTVWLDPLEVESLTHWRHDELVAIVLSHAYDDDTGDPAPVIEEDRR